MCHITAAELALWQAGGLAFDLRDVRRAAARLRHGGAIAGARWLDPAAWLDWKDSCLPPARPLVLYCAHGQEISQGLGAALRVMGIDARHLQGGIAGWQAAGHAVVPLPG